MRSQTDDFCYLLIRASKVLGSLHGVAVVLQVQPKQVFDWIADIERPSEEQMRTMEKRLRSNAALA